MSRRALILLLVALVAAAGSTPAATPPTLPPAKAGKAAISDEFGPDIRFTGLNNNAWAVERAGGMVIGGFCELKPTSVARYNMGPAYSLLIAVTEAYETESSKPWPKQRRQSKVGRLCSKK